MSRWQRFRGLVCRAQSLVGGSRRLTEAARRQRAEFYARTWSDAARTLGAETQSPGDNFLRISRRGHSTTVFLNYTCLDDPVSLRLAGQKAIVNRLVSERNIPVPPFCAFDLKAQRQAHSFLAEHGECVVKPASGTGGGQGVTTGIRKRSDLNRAIVRAAGFGTQMLIEKQVAGHNVRLLFLDGVLLDAVQRNAPAVTGDGRHSVRQLVALNNAERLSRGGEFAQTMLFIDADAKNTLRKQQRHPGSVLSRGESVLVKTVINDNTADDNVTVTDVISDDIVETARSAAAAVGLRLAGVDIIAADLTQDLRTSGGVVLEVNSTPGLHFHYAKRDGPREVAVPILEACLNCSRHPSRICDDQIISDRRRHTPLNCPVHA